MLFFIRSRNCMKIVLLTGSNGFIARNFTEAYKDDYRFILLSQHKSETHFTIDELSANPELVKSVAIIINLAGANIGAKRWSTSRKQVLIDSRANTTSKLVAIFNKFNPSAHFISASAVGIYSPNLLQDDGSPINYNNFENFSQQITKTWETAALNYDGPLTITRFGVVLSAKGGAFPEMLRPFLFGFGGRLGNGSQFFPWIALPDLLAILKEIIEQRRLGIYTLVAPEFTTNRRLSSEIAAIWQRPNWLNLPSFIIKTLFGQMGQELFLNSLLIKPTRLIKENFQFSFPDLKSTLLAIYRKKI